MTQQKKDGRPTRQDDAPTTTVQPQGLLYAPHAAHPLKEER